MSIRLPLLLAFTAAAGSAQCLAQNAHPGQPSANTATISTGTELIVVDVIVQDRSGHPVRGLKLSDFHLEENKAGQTVRYFDEHDDSAASLRKRPPLPPLPPGTFTDYSPLPDNSTLNVLLLDALNTPVKDQEYVHSQLRKFVAQSAAGARIAIFGLSGSHLTLLQGFTSDPTVLKTAVAKNTKTHISTFLADPAGTGDTPESLSDQIANDSAVDASVMAVVNDTVASLKEFEAKNAVLQTELRTRYTLQAFNQLARYLGGFPGRKNLIWFSESFPFSIAPDPNIQNPFDVARDSTEQFRETTSLLTRARVAVYPADTQETLEGAVFSQPNTGKSPSYGRDPTELDDFNRANAALAQEHGSMAQMADSTGGHAFYDGRPLTDVIASVIDTGSSYYTLAYSPLNRNWDGAYRTIRVVLQGDAATHNLKLAYRRGYYADDPNNRRTGKSTSLLTASAAFATAPTAGMEAYAVATMRRGGPTPSDVIFEARVLPDATTVESNVAPHNSPNPNGTFRGPFRLIDIDIAALPSNFELKQQPDGLRHGSVEYVTYVYDTDGRLLNTDSATVALGLTPDLYAKLSANGLGFRQQVSVPAKGESFLRIAVHDVPSGRFGVMEVPVSSVIRLPPAPATTATSSR